MKLTWILLISLLVFVAIFSVQNAEPMTVHFIAWKITISAALVIQLAALLGALVGLIAGTWLRRNRLARETPATPPPPTIEPPI